MSKLIRVKLQTVCFFADCFFYTISKFKNQIKVTEVKNLHLLPLKIELTGHVETI